MPRKIISELRFPLKAVEYKDDREGGFLIGNCDIGVDLQGMVVRIIPPLTPKDEGEIIILNGAYSDEDFEDYMGDELDDIPFYFTGMIKSNVPRDVTPRPWVSDEEDNRDKEQNSHRLVRETVWRFFTNDVESHANLEEYVLLVAKTQVKESVCSECDYSDGKFHKTGEDECPRCQNDRWYTRRPDKSQQIKVVMYRRDIKQAA